MPHDAQPSKLAQFGGWLLSLVGANAPAATIADGTSRAILSRRWQTVDAESALSLTAFYRGVQIHATAMCQLGWDLERNGRKISAYGFVVQPDLDTDRSDFLEYTTVSLYVDGNAFWLKTLTAPGHPDPTKVVNLTALNPREVGVYERIHRDGTREVYYTYRNVEYAADRIEHLKFLHVPGRLRGLGPVEAARLTFEGALEVREYGARWLSDASSPDGVLTTDQELGPGDTEKYKHVWYGRNPDGSAKEGATANPRERLRVLGKGLHYEALVLKPADVQFLETQKFNTLDIARLIGAPASLMLVAVEGSNATYANVEQEWIGYVRFTLMNTIRKIEEAFSRLYPRGVVARASIEALLRSDTKTRYEGYNLAIDGGWMDPDEAREHEGLPPLTDEQRARIAENNRKTTTTTTSRGGTE